MKEFIADALCMIRGRETDSMAETSKGFDQRKLPHYALVICAHLMGVFWSIVWLGKNLMVIAKDPAGFFRSQKRMPPALLRSMEYGEHAYIHLKNGIRIHYVVSGPVDAPLMLCLHGFPEFWYSWRHQLRYFRKDFRVVAVDLRGYGDSSRPTDMTAYEVPQLIDDVRCIIEALGYKSCHLLSHDWGGLIAWQFGSVYPEMIDKFVVMNAPHPKVFWKFAAQNPKQILKSWYVFLFQLPYIPELVLRSRDFLFLEACLTVPPMGARAGTYSKEDIEAYKYTFGTPGALTAAINYYRNSFRWNPPKPVSFRPLDFPILVIFGTGDQAISSETALLSGQFAAGTFELKYVEGASHWLHEEVPELVNETIEKFLRDN